MAYATNTTILTLLPIMPQSSGSGGYTRITTLIESHISRADNVINSKICGRYNASAFDTSGGVPPLLRTLSEDIASYYTVRSEFSGDGQNVNDWTDKFRDAVDILNEIRDGTMDLVNTAGSQIAPRSSATVDVIDSNTEDYTPAFGEDDALSWAVDSDKLDDLDDNR